MIYVRSGGGFIDPNRIVVCVNVYENAFPQFIGLEVVNPDGGTATAYDKFSISVANQPTPPSDLSAELFPKGKVNLTFQDNSTNETGFVVEQSLNGGAWTVVKNIKANRGIGTITCTLTGLRPGNDYDYQVRAVNKSDGNIASPAASLNSSITVDSKLTGRPVIDFLEYSCDEKELLLRRPDRVERTERWLRPVVLDPARGQGRPVRLDRCGGWRRDGLPRLRRRDGHEVQLQDRGPQQLQHRRSGAQEDHAVTDGSSPG